MAAQTSSLPRPMVKVWRPVSGAPVRFGWTCHAVAGVLCVGEQDAVRRRVVARRVHGVGSSFV
jgi:hypothetical protein